MIFLTETKCKIRFINIRFNCKRKNVGAKVGGKSKVNCSYFITPPGHCAFVPVALHSRYISLVGCISTAKNLDANLFLIPFAETLGA